MRPAGSVLRASRRLALAGLALAVAAPAGAAQVLGGPEPPPVSWEQKLGSQVPLDARFTTADGREVALGQLLGERPTVLALVYYECPMLCNLVLEGLVASLREVTFDAGEEYDVLVVSIDPDEGPGLAAAKRESTLEAYGRDGAERSWHFLTGDEEPIARLAESVGFGFTYVPQTDEYAHAAGVAVLTPGGVLSRVLLGTTFEPRDVRLALVEAADGGIGSVVDQVLLRCFHYDPERGRYGLAILSSLRVAGILTVLLLGGFVVRLLRRERRGSTPPSGART